MSDDEVPGADGAPKQPPRTIVRPNPGGRLGGARAAPAAPAAPRADARVPAPGEATPGVNPLVDAAAEVFALVVYLHGQTTAPDVDTLRTKAAALLDRFDRRAAEARVEPDIHDVARYALAATVDDAVLGSPWGLSTGWAQQTLVGMIYRQSIGGEQFFEHLSAAQSDPVRCRELVELMYLCLSLGFRGVYGMQARRQTDNLEDRRLSAFAAVRAGRDGLSRGLSARWKGVDTTRRPVRELIPMWLVAAVALAATGLLFYLATDRTGAAAGAAVAEAQAMPDPGLTRVRQIDPPPIVPPPPPPPPPQEERVSAFLGQEIAEGLVTVTANAGRVRIRLAGAGMFPSGSADLKPGFEAALDRIAFALNGEDGPILLEGHADADPIATARFPSNFHLAEARARAVAAYLGPRLDAPERLTVISMGATRLLDPGQPKGAVNRRVEFVLARDGAEAVE